MSLTSPEDFCLRLCTPARDVSSVQSTSDTQSRRLRKIPALVAEGALRGDCINGVPLDRSRYWAVQLAYLTASWLDPVA